MAHEAPVFTPNNADLQVTDTTARNCWILPGDTPEKLRVYTDPVNLSKHQDVGFSTICYGWSNLPPGTLLSFTVSCIYSDGDEKPAQFYARTTGQPNPPAPTPLPLIDNVAVNVLPYLRGVELSFDNSEALQHADIDLQELPGGSRHLVTALNRSGGPAHTVMTIGSDKLKYSTSYNAWLVGRSRSGSVEFPVSFTTHDDPRLQEFSPDDHVKHTPLGGRKTKSLTVDDNGGTMTPVEEIDPDAGPHIGATP